MSVGNLQQGADAVLLRHLAAAVDGVEVEMVAVEHDALQPAPVGTEPEVALPVHEEGRDARLRVPPLPGFLAEEGVEPVADLVVPGETALLGENPKIAVIVHAAGIGAALSAHDFRDDDVLRAVVQVQGHDAAPVGTQEQLLALRDAGDEGDIAAQACRERAQMPFLEAHQLSARRADIQGVVRHLGAEGGRLRRHQPVAVDAPVGQDPGVEVRVGDDGVDRGVFPDPAETGERSVEHLVVRGQEIQLVTLRAEDGLDARPLASHRIQDARLRVEAVQAVVIRQDQDLVVREGLDFDKMIAARIVPVLRVVGPVDLERPPVERVQSAPGREPQLPVTVLRHVLDGGAAEVVFPPVTGERMGWLRKNGYGQQKEAENPEQA